MLPTLLATKLYVPKPRTNVVIRSRLHERLRVGAQGKLTLISAPAGFGKTTLISAWLASNPISAAWVSLDRADSDPTRFLAYLVSGLQRLVPQLDTAVLTLLQSPQPPPSETILTLLLNDLAAISADIVLILDDYHTIENQAIDSVVSFFIDHLPPQLHLIIATREDPSLPLARLRARGQLTEVRAADLRFNLPEASGFLNDAMGLNLAADAISALEQRTEGWVAGLQLAAISLQGQIHTAQFIQGFTGSHHFVLDYLLEEVLQQQPQEIQDFLIQTSILGRLCGSLADAVVDGMQQPAQAIIEYLERANLFLIPLDNERQWYRYHHLFAELLRQRLPQHQIHQQHIAELHIRASNWYETHHLELEAFQHATAANDIERAERLIEEQNMPLHHRGAARMILEWLASLPINTLNARPALWWRHGALLLVNGQTAGVAEKLQAAEDALPDTAATTHRNLIGRIATARATLALTRYDSEAMIHQSQRALEYLPEANSNTRANALWTLGFAYQLQKNYPAARDALQQSIVLSQRSQSVFTTILASISLGNVQEAENQLYTAAATFRHVLELSGDQPLQVVNEAHLGLARILYQWNNLPLAESHAQQGIHLARQYDQVIDRFIIAELLLARIKLAQDDPDAAAVLLAQASEAVRQPQFRHRAGEVAAGQVAFLMQKGEHASAKQLAEAYDIPISQVRLLLAQGEPQAALRLLRPLHQQAEAHGWLAELLQILVLEALAEYSGGNTDQACQFLLQALAATEPQGILRMFLDEGTAMEALLAEAADRRIMPHAIKPLLAAFQRLYTQPVSTGQAAAPALIPAGAELIEPLSQRELEILQLVAQGLSNEAISKRLFLALSTVKGHNQRIFEKLQVERRTEAVARARALGLI
jgi:LuxR family transcriptional regulator, maltose regulon positive regulatory protein